MKGKWTLETASAMINRNGGRVGGKSIQHDHAGIGVWGAIDYLINVHGFKHNKR